MVDIVLTINTAPNHQQEQDPLYIYPKLSSTPISEIKKHQRYLI